MDGSTAYEALVRLANTNLFAALSTAVISSLLGAYFGLKSFRHQARELIDGAITWQWTRGHHGGMDEEPYLAIQNRSAVPAYIVRARFLRGLFLRTEARKYAFSYAEPTDGNFPLEVRPQGVTSFPLYTGDADRIADKALLPSRWLGYLLKRPYVWIELSTISGHTVLVPANDATSFKERPLWLEGRWLPEPTPDWAKK